MHSQLFQHSVWMLNICFSYPYISATNAAGVNSQKEHCCFLLSLPQVVWFVCVCQDLREEEVQLLMTAVLDSSANMGSL